MKLATALILASLPSAAALAGVTWETKRLDDKFYSEGGAIADINKDGKMDVVSGPYWYQGPEFTERHAIYEVKAYEPRGYSEVFFQFAPDINRDGWPDVLIYGWPGKQAWWLENPKGGKEPWKKHFIMEGIDGESPAWTDVTGDGKPDIVCAKAGSFGYASPPEDPTQPWPFVAVTPADKSVQRYTHGLGIGDVNKDGQLDLIETRGWWQNPGSKDGTWTLNPVPFNPEGGAQIYVHDFNGDGANDIITVSDPHAYGMSWFEQVPANGGAATWKEHKILTEDPAKSAGGLVVSQLHAVDFIDVDGDGQKDIVTGKRWWAHAPKPDGSGGDPGVNDPALIFWIKVTREGQTVKFTPAVIHNDSGVGTQLSSGDLNGDGFPDFLTASKKGTLIHLQKRTP